MIPREFDDQNVYVLQGQGCQEDLQTLDVLLIEQKRLLNVLLLSFSRAICCFVCVSDRVSSFCDIDLSAFRKQEKNV